MMGSSHFLLGTVHFLRDEVGGWWDLGGNGKNGLKGRGGKTIKKNRGSGENLWSFHKLMRNSPAFFTKYKYLYYAKKVPK